MTYESVLSALADPTRRRLYERLRDCDRTVGELARLARITQPAASQHLRVLREARLVTSRRDGTRRHYRASREGLAELRRYVETLWDDVLGAFAGDAQHGAEPSAGRSAKTPAAPKGRKR
jgi:DNA-binding transcriptional ArsR family regulator